MATGMEVWGGIECTVNRVGDTFRDQCRMSGHHDRPDDLNRVAALGIRTLRYPVLWERVAPDRPDDHDWRWSDVRLATLAELGIAPIVGLLHHGSGPAYTSLVDPDFPAKFAAYAAAAAARYPRVEAWTPINEPLTTARFSALYGHWYPHARDERLFWRALLNQVDATRAAMRAIRAVRSDARLIQTEDLGQAYATPELAGAAKHLNDRRWMTWDLLTGRVQPGHALWERLVEMGLADRARAIADDPCPPDVIGINHYPTSDRFLDHRTAMHPAPLGDAPYHDIEALRVLDPAPAGLGDLLRQSWQRYAIPLAVTECHLGCTRDEQMRWLVDAWRACARARDDGADVRALTAWALFGCTDWNSLLVEQAAHYEPGAFDLRGGAPRPTALAALVTRMAAGAAPIAATASGAALGGAGWWRREVRFEHPRFPHASADPGDEPASGPPILIAGATGTLGQAFAGAARLRDLPFVLTGRAELDIADPDSVERALARHRPWAVVNAAGWVRVDDAEDDAAGCDRANAEGAAVLAAACARRGIHFTGFSSDLVFDGRSDRAYVESDPVAPLNAYGRSKAGAEARCLASNPAALMVRTAAFFSPYDAHNFARHVEHALRKGRHVQASAEHVITPTYVPDLVHACLDLAIDGESGLWHLTQGEAMSWLAFGRRVAAALDLDAGLVVAADPAALGWRAVRPVMAALGSSRGRMLPSWDDALGRYAAVRNAAVAAAASRISM